LEDLFLLPVLFKVKVISPLPVVPAVPGTGSCVEEELQIPYQEFQE
jgi:hypothetical protein